MVKGRGSAELSVDLFGALGQERIDKLLLLKVLAPAADERGRGGGTVKAGVTSRTRYGLMTAADTIGGGNLSYKSETKITSTLIGPFPPLIQLC